LLGREGNDLSESESFTYDQVESPPAPSLLLPLPVALPYSAFPPPRTKRPGYLIQAEVEATVGSALGGTVGRGGGGLPRDEPRDEPVVAREQRAPRRASLGW